jgi:hypothetical protein
MLQWWCTGSQCLDGDEAVRRMGQPHGVEMGQPPQGESQVSSKA